MSCSSFLMVMVQRGSVQGGCCPCRWLLLSSTWAPYTQCSSLGAQLLWATVTTLDRFSFSTAVQLLYSFCTTLCSPGRGCPSQCFCKTVWAVEELALPSLVSSGRTSAAGLFSPAWRCSVQIQILGDVHAKESDSVRLIHLLTSDVGVVALSWSSWSLWSPPLFLRC